MTLLVITGGDTSLPGRFVNFLIIEKTIDKVKEICYTLVTIKKGNKSYDNLYYTLQVLWKEI